ncbi:MAG: polymerase [Comamonadaceae bacterium CG_4_9_14_0_8_um_filter_57_21]|nr:O-antigen ligase family protein [Rhodoferax sp.]PIZ22748.1 MAG: polymerase [Comamonadaceae bacterium CG_4_10_14_0_8_um_filter_57_29]PJC21300.1 MAG: polymerase [Comamonadaceae bacterium CG_4_9_14_0_8_um_filter_57_21]
MTNLTRTATGLRIFAFCIVAASVSLPMAWVSLGKLVLFVACLVCLGKHLFTGSTDEALDKLWAVRIILLILASFALSMTWTEAPSDIALLAFAKHSKLLELALLVILIRNAREARIALAVFFISQGIFISSSWVMAAGFRVPWASSAINTAFNSVVYSTYLDQTLIFSAAAAVLWHLRLSWPGLRWVAGFLAIAALANNLFLQEGRTGYLASIAVLVLALVWEVPKKLRLLSLVVIPLVVLSGAYLGSDKLQHRTAQMLQESQSYAAQGSSETSSGFRLHAWRRSIQAMAQQPLIGHGVGSWTSSVKHIEGQSADQVFGTGLASNPHQEFLLWGVELGVVGTLLLLALVASLVRDALRFEMPVRRATLSVVAVMVVGCMFNSSLYDALIGDFFCVTLGVLLARGIRTSNRHKATWPATPSKALA